MSPSLSDLLGKAYDAIVLKKGDEDAVLAEFKEALETPSFAGAAAVRLRCLESFETYLGATGIPLASRDFVGAMQLNFMRKAFGDG